MITTLAALALLAPADTPIEPLEQTAVEFFLSTPDAETLCVDIGEMSNLIDVLGTVADTDLAMIFDMAVSYWQDAAEQGWDPTAAMTIEAEDTFRAWVYSCGGRTQP